MIKVVVELFDGMPDDEAHDGFRRRMLQAMVKLGGPLGDGVLDLSDTAGNLLGARVIGVFEPSEVVRDSGVVKPL